MFELRDLFAAAALMGSLAYLGWEADDKIQPHLKKKKIIAKKTLVKSAYSYADEMLKQRGGK